ncbi:hypothetical protein, partial [Marinobacter salarius]
TISSSCCCGDGSLSMGQPLKSRYPNYSKPPPKWRGFVSNLSRALARLFRCAPGMARSALTGAVPVQVVLAG